MGTTGLAALGDGDALIVRLGFRGVSRVNLHGRAGVTFEQLLAVLSRVQPNPARKRQLEDAITADEVAQLAQVLAYSLSGSNILSFCGQSAPGVR